MSPHRPNHDETLEALADRLRRLTPPPVPAGLEARLLAAIPVTPRSRRRARSWIAAAVLLATAAAALLAIRLPQREPPPVPSIRRQTAAAPTLWRYEQALRHSDVDASVVLNRAMPAFEWPVAAPGPEVHSDRLGEPLQ